MAVFKLIECFLLARVAFADIQLPLFDRESLQPTVSISRTWEVLGPFQIGTRETTWGADPLEHLGGFRSLLYDSQVKYRSSLGSNGTVGWSIHEVPSIANSTDLTEASLTVGFPNIDWVFLQSIYGWASLQYQAWARGCIVIDAEISQSVVLFTDNILEYWIDGTPYFGGDFYSYHRAPLVLRLDPGVHRIDLRLLRDVRAMGGIGEPEVQVKLKAQLSSGGLGVIEEKLLLPDVVDGKLASHLASVPIRNEDQEWIDVLDIESLNDSFSVSMHGTIHFILAPGQSRPLKFQVTARTLQNMCISLRVMYRLKGSVQVSFSPPISSEVRSTTVSEPQKITFLHPGGIVSYAILRPPLINISSSIDCSQSLPILLNLHGAGLEADSFQVRHMLDAVPNLKAWVLFPTGVTPWSGDDWHTWGFADVEAAITAIPTWIQAMAWGGPQADPGRLIVSGHSNGGQGTWFALTHQPDRIIAAAAVSGYSSIQSYVPYQFWNEMDPRVNAVLQTSLIGYRHELLVENFAGIPILQQHGGADGNVPVYHSRRMSQLICQSEWTSEYVELPGKGHWFAGTMTTKPLRDFYNSILKSQKSLPELPQYFRIIIPSSGVMGSRAGIVIDQLVSPDQLATIDVVRNVSMSKWTLRTSNVHRFHLSVDHFHGVLPSTFEVDGSLISVPVNRMIKEEYWFIRTIDGVWLISYDSSWRSIKQRYGGQSGTLDAILRTSGHFTIHSPGVATIAMASQIARNLFQYFGADSQIDMTVITHPTQSGNAIIVSLGEEALTSIPTTYPIAITPGKGVSVRSRSGRERLYPFEDGLGAIFLTPLRDERLMLLIWGFDDSGLRNAARLLPMLTGVGQPDFVIVSKRSALKGAAGALALGFFDHSWNVSQASFLS